MKQDLDGSFGIFLSGLVIDPLHQEKGLRPSLAFDLLSLVDDVLLCKLTWEVEVDVFATCIIR